MHSDMTLEALAYETASNTNRKTEQLEARVQELERQIAELFRLIQQLGAASKAEGSR